MSSYHDLIVNQINQDRQRLASPRMLRGASYETSTESVTQIIRERERVEMEKKYNVVRRVAAKYRIALVRFFGGQAIAQR